MSEAQFNGQVKWRSPSNIALVKYWGKKGFQLPSNASISFTLDACHTDTLLNWSIADNQDVSIYVDGVKSEGFKPKVETFFKHISLRYPELSQFSFELHTQNTFPHSSGIASSASGMSALALCVCSMLEQMNLLKDDFYREASNLARIGSGSASRSVYGGCVEWGIHEAFDGSSDEFAIPFTEVDQVFHNFHDTILLIHEGQKSVSSTVGHALLNDHIFASQRFTAAQENMLRMKLILQYGDLDKFTQIVENEALMLHALMMTSSPSFILMQPDTLAVIQKVRDFRKQNGGHITFTLDAGANVHLMYPTRDSDKAMSFIESDLVEHCANGRYICDSVGQGPTELEC